MPRSIEEIACLYVQIARKRVSACGPTLAVDRLSYKKRVDRSASSSSRTALTVVCARSHVQAGDFFQIERGMGESWWAMYGALLARVCASNFFRN